MVAGLAEFAEDGAVAVDESSFLRSGPALELAFPLNRGGQIIE